MGANPAAPPPLLKPSTQTQTTRHTCTSPAKGHGAHEATGAPEAGGAVRGGVVQPGGAKAPRHAS